MNIAHRIQAAIQSTRSGFPSHWTPLLASRTLGHPAATGSVTTYTDPAALEQALLNATWEPYSHPAILPECTAFVTRDIRGRSGIIPLADLPADAKVTLRDSHQTGCLSAEVIGDYGSEVGETVMILGPEKGQEIVFTFHPGAPIAPSTLATIDAAQGQVLTPAEAMALGFDLAKIRR